MPVTLGCGRHFRRCAVSRHACLVVALVACAFVRATGPASAQTQGSCVTANLLRVDAAFSRPGSGGTFDYSVQITNLTARPVTFRLAFRMTNAQMNPAIIARPQTLPRQASQIFVLGSGLALSTPIRITGGVLLTCA
jgi:hypothetical protein